MRSLFLFFFLLLSFSGVCQEIQLSQYYTAPLILNPAMTGWTECFRVGTNVRSQWTNLPGGAYNTAAVFGDVFKTNLNSGFGVLFLHDAIGNSQITSNEISLLYSYLVPASKSVNIRLGLQGSYIFRNAVYKNLRFADQFSGTLLVNNITNDPVTHYPTVHFPDFSTGIVIFDENNYWIGFSAHHINKPQQNFYVVENRTNIQYSIHGGYNFYLHKNSPYINTKKKGLRITPTFLYKMQGKFDQMDLGVYFIKRPFLFGGWYRGIFVKKDFKITNKDAVSLHAGLRYDNFSFIYSYDFTTSRLNIKNTKGSHEISLVYEFCLSGNRQKKKPPRRMRRLPCPDFSKR